MKAPEQTDGGFYFDFAECPYGPVVRASDELASPAGDTAVDDGHVAFATR